MAAEIKVPTLGESVTEATVARWLKQPGDVVARDEPVVELETDKVTLEVPAPAAGILGAIQAAEGANVPVGAVLGTIAEGAAATAPHPSPLPASGEREAKGAALTSVPSPRLRGEGQGEGQPALERAGPAVRKLVAESGVDATALTPSGPSGRLTKTDVMNAPAPARQREPAPEPVPRPPRESP